MILGGNWIRLSCTWIFFLFPFLSMYTIHFKEKKIKMECFYTLHCHSSHYYINFFPCFLQLHHWFIPSRFEKLMAFMITSLVDLLLTLEHLFLGQWAYTDFLGNELTLIYNVLSLHTIFIGGQYLISYPSIQCDTKDLWGKQWGCSNENVPWKEQKDHKRLEFFFMFLHDCSYCHERNKKSENIN